MKTIYAVRFNQDSTEGRGLMIPRAHFESAEVAWEFLENLGYTRDDSNNLGFVDIFPIEVYTDLEDFNVCKITNLKYQALAKLTTEEKAALGILNIKL